eukprot:2835207-Pyramimonas_sp.AAC.1
MHMWIVWGHAPATWNGSWLCVCRRRFAVQSMYLDRVPSSGRLGWVGRSQFNCVVSSPLLISSSFRDPPS